MTKNYVNKLTFSGLGALPADSSRQIRANETIIKDVLQRAKRKKGFAGFGKTSSNAGITIPIDEFIEDKRYNPNINKDDIMAWVYYKRAQGVPMKGWEKYFIKEDKKNSSNVLYVNTTSANVLTPEGTPICVVVKDSYLGMETITNKSDEDRYSYFTDKMGNLKKIAAKDVRREKSTLGDNKEINRLISAGVLFYNMGRLLPYPIYTYGNMYQRENELAKEKDYIINNFGQSVYELHQKAIAEAKPKLISILDPIQTNRMQISPISEYARKFVIPSGELDGYSKTWQQTNDKEIWKEYVHSDYYVTLSSAYEWWLNENREDESLREKNVTCAQIIKYYLRGENRPKNRYSDEDWEAIQRNVRMEGERIFPIFLERALLYEDKQVLDYDWNSRFNAFSKLRYDKVPIGFSASRMFKSGDFELRPAQREGVAFMEMKNSGCISFDVGVGKTLTAISELAMAMQEGKCKRPLVVVPNPTYVNWISELFGDENSQGVLYGTGITLNSWYNLGVDITARAEDVKDNSITLVSYQGFKLIGFSDNVASELQKQLVGILMQDFSSLDPKVGQKLLEKIETALGRGKEGAVVNIDDCGFDYIVFDEAHNAKKAFTSVTAQDKDKKFHFADGKEPSSLALKLFFHANYVQRMYGGNIMLLTATPFVNNPLEVYAMLSYIAYEELVRYGYHNIEEFCETFIEESNEIAVDAKGDLAVKPQVRKFRNRLVLQQLIFNNFNYKTGEEANVKRPCKINLPMLNKDGHRLPKEKQILTYLQLNDMQAEFQNYISTMMNEAEGTKEAGKVYLKGMSMSMNNAISPYLFLENLKPEDVFDFARETGVSRERSLAGLGYIDFVENSPKLKYTYECIKSVKEYHESRGEELSGQIIFIARGEVFFTYIKDYLIDKLNLKRAQAVPWSKKKFSEVEIISKQDAEEKALYMRAFNEGYIKIIIGTASIREGVNLQKRSTCLYNLVPDWNPTNIQQLEGRLYRQGNTHQFVRIVLPLMQNSIDTFIFQKIEEKTNRINDIWQRSDRSNVLNVDALDPEEVKISLISDINKLVNMRINKETEYLNRDERILGDQIKALKEFKNNYERYNIYKEKVINDLRQAQSNIEQYNDIVAMNPTQEQIEKMSETMREKAINTLKRYEELKNFLNANNFADKDLLKMSQQVKRMYPAYYDGNAAQFSELVSTIAKMEKSVLSTYGYTKEDDVAPLVEQVQSKLQETQDELERLKSSEHRDFLYKEIEQKKRDMAVIGVSLEERVKEFKKLNYILSVPFNRDRQLENNYIPSKEECEKWMKEKDAKPAQMPSKKLDKISDILLKELALFEK